MYIYMYVCTYHDDFRCLCWRYQVSDEYGREEGGEDGEKGGGSGGRGRGGC